MENISGFANATETDGAGFLDILLTLAENFKLLVAGPVLAGVFMLGFAFLLPQTFVSVAVLQADETLFGMMTTAPVLDAVVAKLNLEEGEPASVARQKLRLRINSSVGRSDKLLTVSVMAKTPQLAKQTADLLIEQSFLVSRPRGSIKERLEAQLIEAQSRLKRGRESADSLMRDIANAGAEPTSESNVARSLASTELMKLIADAQKLISSLEAELEGVNAASLIQPPTLPSRPVSPNKTWLAITAAVVVELLLLVFVFGRQALRTASADPESAKKLARIRASLGMQPDLNER